MQAECRSCGLIPSRSAWNAHVKPEAGYEIETSLTDNYRCAHVCEDNFLLKVSGHLFLKIVGQVMGRPRSETVCLRHDHTFFIVSVYLSTSETLSPFILSEVAQDM